jgi:hypothetical protein
MERVGAQRLSQIHTGKFDDIPCRPLFNDADLRGKFLRDDKRWVHRAPPAGNADSAFVRWPRCS